MSKTIKCPTCEKALEWSTDNPYRPFCSERCKLIDLGAWADGSHFIAGEPGYDPRLSDEQYASDDSQS